MKKIVEALKICYRYNWGEIDSDYLQLVYDICREEGVKLSGCNNSTEIIKKIFSYLKYNKIVTEEEDQVSNKDNILNINDYRKRKYQIVYDKLMDKTNIDLVLYNILARELLKFRYNRLKNAPITQPIDEEDACSEEVLFIGIIGSLCKQYFAYGMKDGFTKYPNGDAIKDELAESVYKED